ncbi:MAG TPA: helicase-related protein [Kofleriaceae bacterium]
MRAWLRDRGARVAAVHVGAGSDDREQALQALERGELDAVCAVDVFNEGIDLPSIDRVVMLRPTESSVVFLQQLGRGLRAAPGKAAVHVIAFVGNHRMFLERLRVLLSLGGDSGTERLRALLEPERTPELPAGCSVELELEAKLLLARLFQVRGVDEVERAYRELCLERGADDLPASRPTAGQLQRMGYLPARLRERHGSWFEFVRAESGLAPGATWRAWGKGRDVSRRLPDGAIDKAKAAVAELLARPEPDRWLLRGNRRARIVGSAPGGGLRIDGGPGGFVERTVSLTDLAWVIQAAADVASTGGLLDEARVNKLRYLEGTPKGSTRWIDTGWAIAAWQALGGGRGRS